MQATSSQVTPSVDTAPFASVALMGSSNTAPNEIVPQVLIRTAAANKTSHLLVRRRQRASRRAMR